MTSPLCRQKGLQLFQRPCALPVAGHSPERIRDMSRLFSKAGVIPVNEVVPVITYSPVVLEFPGRPVPLQVPRLDRLLAGMAALLVAMLLAGCGGAAASVAAPVAGLPVAATGDGNSGSATLTATDLNAWLDGLMPAALATGGIAGGIVSVVKDGEVLTRGDSAVATWAPRLRVRPVPSIPNRPSSAPARSPRYSPPPR